MKYDENRTVWDWDHKYTDSVQAKTRMQTADHAGISDEQQQELSPQRNSKAEEADFSAKSTYILTLNY